MDEEMRAELTKHVQAVRDWQDFLQGELEAIRVALFELLRSSQGNTELRARMEQHLETRLRLMREATPPDPQGTIAGFESTLRDLVAGFHVGNPTDTNH